MAIDDRAVRRTTDDAERHLDRARRELRDMQNEFDRLGSDFRNDRRFSSDSYRLKDEMHAADRELNRLRDRVRAVQRNVR